VIDFSGIPFQVFFLRLPDVRINDSVHLLSLYLYIHPACICIAFYSLTSLTPGNPVRGACQREALKYKNDDTSLTVGIIKILYVRTHIFLYIRNHSSLHASYKFTFGSLSRSVHSYSSRIYYVVFRPNTRFWPIPGSLQLMRN
jgi:hypothetical protein